MPTASRCWRAVSNSAQRRVLVLVHVDRDGDLGEPSLGHHAAMIGDALAEQLDPAQGAADRVVDARGGIDADTGREGVEPEVAQHAERVPVVFVAGRCEDVALEGLGEHPGQAVAAALDGVALVGIGAPPGELAVDGDPVEDLLVGVAVLVEVHEC